MEKRTVVIADDEMIERRVLVKLLRNHYPEEIRFLEAENGRQVLELFEKEKPEIYLLDIEMPGINGLEAAAEIRRKDSGASIIFLTAFDDFQYAKRAITVRALDYLLKPYDEKELLLALDTALHFQEELSRWKTKETMLGEKASQEVGLRNILKNQENEDGGESSEDIRRQHILRYIRENYMKDISVQDIATALSYSEAYFCKLFKQYFGKNFITYLSEYRIRLAMEKLSETEENIKEIGKSVGYQDSNYFTKVFRRITGKSPSDYRTLKHGR